LWQRIILPFESILNAFFSKNEADPLPRTNRLKYTLQGEEQKQPLKIQKFPRIGLRSFNKICIKSVLQTHLIFPINTTKGIYQIFRSIKEYRDSTIPSSRQKVALAVTERERESIDRWDLLHRCYRLLQL